MSFPRWIIGLAAGLALATVSVSTEAGDARRPNILFILADDLGWRDLGCYGNSIFETPHLDRLAHEGLRLTQAYAPAPLCSASRASFLTGKTPARLGFEFDDGFTSQTRPHSVLRSGPWKLIHFDEDDRDELYRLPSDRGEQKDRRRSDPDVAAKLRKRLDAALDACGARRPVPNPDWPPEMPPAERECGISD